MRFLLIGMSRFARRRVVPAAASIAEIETIDVASSHATREELAHVPRLGAVYADWREALAAADPSLVYVSLVNSEHARVVRRALELGHHVVVDKPGLPDPQTAEEMLSLARSCSLVLAEATCYAFHPLFAAIESLLADLDASVTTALAVFTPPVPADDWRYDPAEGGGALADTGPYAVSLGRVLWGEEPERIDVIANGHTADAVVTSYSMLAGYPGGRTVIGQFGFTTVYQNMIRLMGDAFTVEVARPFSAPPDRTVTLRVQTGDQAYEHLVEPADSMRVFLSGVLTAAKVGSRSFDAALIGDAQVLARLRAASSFSEAAGVRGDGIIDTPRVADGDAPRKRPRGR